MRDIPTSPRVEEIKRKRKVRKLRMIVLFVLFFIAIIWALSFFSGDKHLIVNKIEINGTHIIYQKDIEDEVYQNISGKYLHLFSRNNSFIYPHDKIYANLLIKFPRIEKLSVSVNKVNTLQINITERIGSYLYCGSNIPENKDDVGENCYFINNDGYIFDKAPYFSGNVYFKFYMALDSGSGSPLAKQMISPERFHKLAGFIDGVTAIGFKPIYIYKDNDGTDYLYLNHNAVSTIPKIMFKDNDDLQIIGDNLAIAMRKKEFADEVNSKYNTLLYIDLRFDNKVLYKFQ